MTTTATTAPQASKRILSIDVLRGIIMIIMALDHSRDYFSGYTFNPTDLQHASTAMFLTRWVTHFCAPIFIFLAGTSVFLSQRSGPGGRRKAAFRLLTRGIWFVFLELTIIRFGWFFDMDYSMIVVQVIWAIGWSMIFLSGVIFLPRQLILAIGLLMVFGHNLLDGVQPGAGAAGVLWQFLHVQSPVLYGNGNTIFIAYPLIPWIGVMALGYCFGVVFTRQGARRNKLLYAIGGSMLLLFVVLRYTNVYGDPSPWAVQDEWWRTILSFVNCTKYPPSLLYLLMTLGVAITSMPLLEKMSGRLGDVFRVYGWVPFFYYVLHIYLIHALALLAMQLLHPAVVGNMFLHPAYTLSVAYGCWLACVAILYLPCRWFMKVKRNNKQWWLSYL